MRAADSTICTFSIREIHGPHFRMYTTTYTHTQRNLSIVYQCILCDIFTSPWSQVPSNSYALHKFLHPGFKKKRLYNHTYHLHMHVTPPFSIITCGRGTHSTVYPPSILHPPSECHRRVTVDEPPSVRPRTAFDIPYLYLSTHQSFSIVIITTCYISR